jgi:F-type H+-transporting ATPase subunit c
MSAMVIFSGAAVVAMALAAFGSAYAQGRTGAAAMDATWKKPEVAGKIRTTMMLALVFMEALTLFVFAIVFVLAGRVNNEIGIFAAVAVLAMGLSATGSAVAQGRAAAAALEASWREPEDSGNTRTSMMLGLVFMEALTLFVFAIVFVLAGRATTPGGNLFGAAAVAAMAIAALGSAISQGKAGAAAMEATWRQPDAAGDIRTSMMLALVFMEALTLFVFAIVFVLSGMVA